MSGPYVATKGPDTQPEHTVADHWGSAQSMTSGEILLESLLACLLAGQARCCWTRFRNQITWLSQCSPACLCEAGRWWHHALGLLGKRRSSDGLTRGTKCTRTKYLKGLGLVFSSLMALEQHTFYSKGTKYTAQRPSKYSGSGGRCAWVLCTNSHAPHLL